MGFVNYGFAKRDVELLITLPVATRIHDDRFWHVWCTVLFTEAQIFIRMARLIAQMCFVTIQNAGYRFGVGVEQQLIGIVTLTSRRFKGSVHPIAIALPR